MAAAALGGAHMGAGAVEEGDVEGVAAGVDYALVVAHLLGVGMVVGCQDGSLRVWLMD